MGRYKDDDDDDDDDASKDDDDDDDDDALAAGQCRDDSDCTPWAPSCSPLGYCRGGVQVGLQLQCCVQMLILLLRYQLKCSS